MTATEFRIRELLIDQFEDQFEELEGKAPEELVFEDTDLEALGLNSLAAVAFLKVVGKEFNVEIPPTEAQHFTSLQDLVSYVDDRKA